MAKSNPLRYTAPLYLGFAATGIGVALPGAVLPALLLRWHLHDEQAGRLFLLAWIGSSLGALLARGSLRMTLAAGSSAISLAGGALVWSGGHGADILMAIYGTGLGLVMTSISLIRQLQTRTNPASTATEMVRLNFAWAVGAVVCPTLAARALASGSLSTIFVPLAIGFLALAMWAAMRLPPMPIVNRGEVRNTFLGLFRKIPPPFLLMTVLITGIEASAGAWLSTYAHRGGLHLGATIEAPTCLWAGLLLSRLFWSAFTQRTDNSAILRGSVALMSVAALMLIHPAVASNRGELLLTGAFLLGFGIGPVYPLLLAWASRFHRGGSIFFIAGIGSALLPWITGLVSQQRASLRAGFAVPLAATLVMLLMTLISPDSSLDRLSTPSTPDLLTTGASQPMRYSSPCLGSESVACLPAAQSLSDSSCWPLLRCRPPKQPPSRSRPRR